MLHLDHGAAVTHLLGGGETATGLLNTLKHEGSHNSINDNHGYIVNTNGKIAEGLMVSN